MCDSGRGRTWQLEQFSSLIRRQSLAHRHQHQGATYVALGAQEFDFVTQSHHHRNVGFQFDGTQQLAIQLRDLLLQRDAPPARRAQRASRTVGLVRQ